MTVSNKITPKKYVITAWELRVGIDINFLRCLERLCKFYDAEPLLISIWREDTEFIPHTFRNFFTIVTESKKFNDNITLHYVPTSAVAREAISQWKGVYKDSAIIPALKMQLITEVSPKLSKITMSTGSVGRLDATLNTYKHLSYTGVNMESFSDRWKLLTNRQTASNTEIAKNKIIPSFIILDVIDNKRFLPRYVSMEQTDCFYDLNYKFSPKKEPKPSQPKAFVFGDVHVFNSDKDALDTSIKIAEHLNPESIVLNDFFDGDSVNPHHNKIERLFAPTIDEEAKITLDALDKLCMKFSKIHYIISNHDLFLDRYLNEGSDKWKEKSENYNTCLKLELFRLNTNKYAVEGLLKFYKYDNIQVKSEQEHLIIAGIYVIHGHEGISGKKAGFKALSRAYNGLLNMGHTHNPSVDGKSINVGTNSLIKQSFIKGANAMLHANGLIQPDGTQQLLVIIEKNDFNLYCK